MCGRFTLIPQADAIKRKFNARLPEDLAPLAPPPRYNIAPTQSTWIIRRDSLQGDRQLALARWGLIPSWAKDPKLKISTINARSEGVSNSPVYRDAFSRSRCLVPASGYYEWKEGQQPKIPHYFHPSDPGDLWLLAGVFSLWSDKTGAVITSFSILTTQANPWVACFHHRMPVILSEDQWDPWLDPDTPSNICLSLLHQPEGPPMAEHKVSTWVNRVSNDCPQAILPYEDPQWDFGE
jgi:putative SOS response-associated peptidase YedK